jgi:hypothetical protein
MLNTANGVTDIAIGLANLGISTSPTGLMMAPFGGLPQIPAPDWSNGLLVEEDPLSHWISKFAGGQGVVTLATLGASYLATSKAAIGSYESLKPIMETGIYKTLNHSSWTPAVNASWIENVIAQRMIVLRTAPGGTWTQWEVAQLQMSGYTRLFHLYLPPLLGEASTIGPMAFCTYSVGANMEIQYSSDPNTAAP